MRLAGPIGAGSPVAAGADGTYYAVTCINTPITDQAQAPDLVAYDGKLQEKWRIALPVPVFAGKWYKCPVPGVVLEENGIMYLAVEADGTYLIAVQTNSPGPADSTWPLRFRDNHGSSWLELN